MATSGVHVCPNAIEAINEMRLSKDNDERIRILRFGFCDKINPVDDKKETQIDVVKRVTQKDLDDANMDAFAYMKLEMFRQDDCAYVLYDCKFETKDTGGKAEMLFLMWCPDSAHIKQKMNFATSKDALKTKMTGVKHKVEISDPSDVATKKEFVEKWGMSDLRSLEGETL